MLPDVNDVPAALQINQNVYPSHVAVYNIACLEDPYSSSRQMPKVLHLWQHPAHSCLCQQESYWGATYYQWGKLQHPNVLVYFLLMSLVLHALLWSVSKITVKLDLKGNDLQELPTGAFSHTPYLTHLSLQNSNIRRVKEGAFRRLGRLVLLNLANNNIEILYQVKLTQYQGGYICINA